MLHLAEGGQWGDCFEAAIGARPLTPFLVGRAPLRI